MADPNDALQQYFNTLNQMGQGIAQPQQPTGAMGSVERFLNHPAVQGLLGAGLASLEKPWHMSMLGNIGRAGLAGLQSYGSARQLQAMQPMMRAKMLESLAAIPQKQAQAASATATAGLRTKQAGMIGPDAQSADHFAVLAQGEGDPTKAQLYNTISDGLRSGRLTMEKVGPILNDIRQGAVADATIKLRNEQIKTEEMRPGLIQAQKGKAEAETRKAEIESTGAPKPKLATIYGPEGATKEVSVGADYAPPTGWSLTKPGTKDVNSQANALISTFARENPLHFYNNAEAWVRDATNYLTGRGIPQEVATQMAQSLARQPVAPAAGPAVTTPTMGTPHAGLVSRY